MTLAALPDDLIAPDYAGGSIANVPATVAALLGVAFHGQPPLRDVFWGPLQGDVKRVVVIILDAMGHNLWRRAAATVADLEGRAAVSGTLTSVFPSTTVNALSCLWTGLAPLQHGLLGLRLFFPEFATLGQMLQLSPNMGSAPDMLVDAGLDPATFLHGPAIAEQFAAGGVPTYSYKGDDIADSALSQMLGRGVAGNYGTVTATEMFARIGAQLEAAPDDPMYIVGYWPTIDKLSHIYSWRGAPVAAELATLLGALQRELLEGLTAEARRGTCLLLLADHGQVALRPEQQIYIEDHPYLQERMLMRSAGEPRTAYIYARQGEVTAVKNYLNEKLGHAVVAGTAAEAVASGLLGARDGDPAITRRLGDVVATQRDGYLLLNPEERPLAERLQGRHGGLTRDEMIVPWLGFRLDDCKSIMSAERGVSADADR